MKIDVKGPIVHNDDKWIYDLFDIESTCPADVSKKLAEAAEKNETVDVDINSGGGDVFSGSEIYSALRAFTGKVNIHVVGIAASAASVIACAGKSDITPTGQIMIHNVSGYGGGDYHEHDKMSEILQQANRAIAAAYVEKTGMSEKDALDLMDKETWITAQDAVDYGLIDQIAPNRNTVETTAERLTASAGGMLPKSVIDKMQNRKQALIDYFSK